MRKFLYPALLAVFITGCGADANVESNASGKNNISSAPVNTTIVSSSNSNQPNPIPPTAVGQTNINAGNSANTNQAFVDVTSVSRRALEQIKSKGKTGDKNAPPIPSTAATPNPAPDNSTLSTAMNEKGVPVETRIFKDHPTLLKVERTFADIENPVTKVYLKNGKILTLPKGAVEKPEFAPAAEILRAAGVKP